MTRTGTTATGCQETGPSEPVAIASGSRSGSDVSLALDVGGLGRLAFSGRYLAQFGDSMFGTRNPNVLIGTLSGGGFDRLVFLARG